MGKYASGKFAKRISDRSGMAFPYNEMVQEWNGSWVHTSEFEPKHPQLEPLPIVTDPQSLQYARSQVKDSRASEDGATIRRRRLCSSCGSRFTTFERIQLRDLIVIKRNGKVVGAVNVNDNDRIIMITNKGKTIKISVNDMPIIGRNTQGVRLQVLQDDEKLVAISTENIVNDE